MTSIAEPLILPGGSVISNRLCKAALTEGLADPRGRATPELNRLYRLWSEGGAGLIISGNVQVDRTHLERPANVVVEDDSGLDALCAMAAAGTAGGNHFWMQINHPGRQTAAFLNPQPMAPSAVAVEGANSFGMPRAMRESEIGDMVDRFAYVAGIAQRAGFTGVQIHAAHGYLLSQFLSPRVNRREDQWGGSLKNRARFLLDICRSVRRQVGPGFPVSVKLNSADFQQGGFTNQDAVEVLRWLHDEGIDLVELSGGNYERLSMSGIDAAESTRRREAYFLDFAGTLRGGSHPPIMITGGFRSRAAMDEALAAGETDMIGIGRPMCVEPDLPAKLLSRQVPAALVTDLWEADRVAGLSGQEARLKPTNSGYYFAQLLNLAHHGAASLSQPVAQAHKEYLDHEAATFKLLSEHGRQD